VGAGRRFNGAGDAGATATAGGSRASPIRGTLPGTRTSKTSTLNSADLYRNAFVLDCNALESIGYQFQDVGRFEALADSGVTALKTTLGGANGTFEESIADIATAHALIEQHPDRFIKVRGHADLERAKPENKLAVIFSFEAASMLEGKLERIDLFRKLDVLVMQLSYNHDTPLGHGCLDGETGGLTELGRQAAARMEDLGIALDLSHSNTCTTAKAIALARKPPLITHAGCRAVFMHPRNKRDEEMRALADKGGVMGLYMLPFLTPEDRQPLLADYMQHMLHALKVCGEDHVGIGTDTAFFTVTEVELKALAQEAEDRRRQGVGAPGENRPPWIPDVNTPRKLERVADALLKHGYAARVADKVLGLNFSRAFREIWAT
jgi:membrane dipeptidase